ncbi:hypothetical protein F442_13330 [Phytophthora nicotianae P10297]|uniref:Uncharacterized protein n=1 Tax=Phytophthora nicotianae P10297 TaxID=1317064 RepID=W2YWY4_PHYNI|nr:hypothetical protein F442_13330 [Phytophthora nicotianae P10297]
MGPVREGLARWKDRPAGRWRLITSARQADPMAGSCARDEEPRAAMPSRTEIAVGVRPSNLAEGRRSQDYDGGERGRYDAGQFKISTNEDNTESVNVCKAKGHLRTSACECEHRLGASPREDK